MGRLKLGKWQRKILCFLYRRGGNVEWEKFGKWYYKELPRNRRQILMSLIKKKLIKAEHEKENYIGISYVEIKLTEEGRAYMVNYGREWCVF